MATKASRLYHEVSISK